MKKANKVPQFHKVNPVVWQSKRFKALSDRDKLLWFYLVSSPHHQGSGCYRLDPKYASADMGTTEDEVLAGLKRLAEADVIIWDDAEDELLIRRWFKHSPPTNGKHAAGLYDRICGVDSDTIRERAEDEFSETEWGAKFLTSPSCTRDA